MELTFFTVAKGQVTTAQSSMLTFLKSSLFVSRVWFEDMESTHCSKLCLLQQVFPEISKPNPFVN